MAVGSPLRGRRRQDLENRSTITSILVLPSDGGRSVMKSTPRCDQGRLGTGSGRSLPDGKWRGLLEMAQSEHPWTNLRTSWAMFGHQKRSFSSERVALAPGWPVPNDVWTEWMRGVRCALMTYCLPGGQPGGSLLETLEEGTEFGDQWMGLTIIVRGKMGSGLSLFSSGAWRRDRASALMFFDPGRYEMEKWKRVKNRAHLAWRGLSLLPLEDTLSSCDR